MMAYSRDISRYLVNLQKEIDGAFLYNILADSEKQPKMAELYRRLAVSEEKHAEIWKNRLMDLGIKDFRNKPGGRARILGALSKRFGPQFVLPTITGNEQADSRAYENQ